MPRVTAVLSLNVNVYSITYPLMFPFFLIPAKAEYTHSPHPLLHSSSFFWSGRLHFWGQVVFSFWVRSSSLFGSGRLHFLGQVVFIFVSGRLRFLGQVVFIFWARSSSFFGSGHLHF